MQTTIRKLFSDESVRFKIPSYQRAYSWDKENIEQFIQDLNDASQSYYLGHFLFEQNATSENDLLIIDGQQRLTTCVILFSVLYHELVKRNKAGASLNVYVDDIRHFYLRDTRKGTQRFTTVPDDNNFFVDEVIDAGENAVEPRPATKSQERIRAARETFEKVCSDKNKMSAADLEEWFELVANAVCTEFRVDDKVKAAQIFAFQNDRGKGLSKLEVLKSYFMLQLYLHSESPEAMREHLHYLEADFSSIYRQIVRVDVEEDEVLLYYWRACAEGKGFDSRDAVKEIKDHLAEIPKQAICSWIKSFVSGLARSFHLVEDIESSPNEEIRNLLLLNNMALAYPFLIKAHLNGTSDTQIARLARLLENVTFRYLIRGGRAEIQSRLNTYLRMKADADYVERMVSGVVMDLRTNSWWVYWSDTTLAEHLDGWMYGNRVDNYLLWRYEMYLCSLGSYSAPLKVGYRELMSHASIEHIAPQTPTDGDPVANGYGAYQDDVSPENGIESGGWLHCIGNLMLVSLSHNTSIGNKPFHKKLASYGKDNLLNQQKEVGSFVSDRNKLLWDKASIERRHRAILDAAKTIWALDKL